MAFDVTHIISSDTSIELLDQLALTCQPSDKIISIGKPQQAEFDAEFDIIQPAFGVHSLAKAKLLEKVNLGSIIHIWSSDLLEIALEVADIKKSQIILSVLSVNSTHEQNKLPWIAGANNISILTRTDAGVQSCLNLGADPKKFFSIPIVSKESDIENIRNNRLRVRRELNISDDKTVLAIPNEILTPESGHKIAIWAHAILSWVLDDIALIVPGDSEEFDNVYKFATNTGFLNNVYFTKNEFTPTEVISACDIALFSGDENNKNLGRIAEAIKQARPVIADNCAEIHEITNAGELAYLIDTEPKTLSSAMLKLLEDKDLRCKLIAACDADSSLFSPDFAKDKLAKIYTTLAEVDKVEAE